MRKKKLKDNVSTLQKLLLLLIRTINLTHPVKLHGVTRVITIICLVLLDRHPTIHPFHLFLLPSPFFYCFNSSLQLLKVYFGIAIFLFPHISKYIFSFSTSQYSKLTQNQLFSITEFGKNIRSNKSFVLPHFFPVYVQELVNHYYWLCLYRKILLLMCSGFCVLLLVLNL